MTFQTTRRSWTKNEINILKKMFANNYTIDVCDKLNRSYSSINGMAHTLGLKKSSAFMKMELKRQADRIKIIGVKTRFKKGREPDNKGRKQVEYMSNEGIEKSAKMRFKKGNLPHNAKSVGDEVTRTYKGGKQYLMLKVAGKRNLVYKHTHIWESKIGKVPPGFNVIFKDGNTLNCNIENLECISNAELLQRNTINRFPHELKSLIRLANKLKRNINVKEQN